MRKSRLWGKIIRVGRRKMLYRHRILSLCPAKWRATWGIEPTMPWTRPKKIFSREMGHPPSAHRCEENWRQPKTTQVIMNSDLFLTFLHQPNIHIEINMMKQIRIISFHCIDLSSVNHLLLKGLHCLNSLIFLSKSNEFYDFFLECGWKWNFVVFWVESKEGSFSFW